MAQMCRAWGYCIASLIFLTMHCPEVFATELLCSLCEDAPRVLGGWGRAACRPREGFQGLGCRAEPCPASHGAGLGRITTRALAWCPAHTESFCPAVSPQIRRWKAVPQEVK